VTCEQRLREGKWAAAPTKAADGYVVRCPDVLEIRVDGSSDPPQLLSIGPDGRLPWRDAAGLRVEGLTVDGVARALEESTGRPPGQITVRVAEYKSQQVYLVGQVKGADRAVPFEGPETVVALLQRSGGITPGAAEGDVYVIRAHVADGRAPELFHVDLRAILRDHDERTDLLLQPYDQISIGQTRRSFLGNCFPPWLRPLYERLLGLHRAGTDS
jgi:protein involved in polysaccharide export with SLBB domain